MTEKRRAYGAWKTEVQSQFYNKGIYCFDIVLQSGHF